MAVINKIKLNYKKIKYFFIILKMEKLLQNSFLKKELMNLINKFEKIILSIVFPWLNICPDTKENLCCLSRMAKYKNIKSYACKNSITALIRNHKACIKL